MPTDPLNEQPIREFADRGVIRLLEYPPNMRALLRIVSAEIADSLDFTRAELLNRTLIPDDLKGREADVIYRIPYIGTEDEALVYMVLENQSEPDRAMPLRLMGNMDRIWEMQWKEQRDKGITASQCNLDPVIPFVFYTGKSPWSSEMSLTSMMRQPPIFTRFIPGWDVLFLSLNGFTEEKYNSSAIAAAFRVLQVANEPLEIIERELQAAMAYLESLPEEFKAEWEMAVRFLVELIRNKRIGAERVLLYNIIDEMVTDYHRPEVREMAMTIAEEDIAKGRVEGRHLERIDLIAGQLKVKFGISEDNARSLLAKKSDSDLVRISLQLLNAHSVGDLGLSLTRH